MSFNRSAAVAATALVLLAAACTSEQPATPSASPTPAAPQATPRPGKQTVSVQFGGKPRSFQVYAPPGYDGTKALPLVVAMHYYPGDGEGVATTSGLNAKADKENFLVVYPDGYAGGFNALICCGKEDDVGFIKLVVDSMVSQWKADPKRVFATGISNGADMSYKVAVELSDMFAAIAPVSGGYSGTKAADAAYMPKSPVSLITFVGAKDRFSTPIETGLKQWQGRLTCTAGAPATLPNDITRIEAKCANGSDVVVYRLAQMGHSWPGAQQGALADPQAGLSATDLMWEFFKAHPKA